MLDNTRHTPLSQFAETAEEVVHTSVLLHETVLGLDIHDGDVVFDGTLGAGGHSYEIATRYPKVKKIIGTDLDPDALARVKIKLSHVAPALHFAEANFREIKKVLTQAGEDHVDRILLDLGVSSFTFFDSGRGFSFQKDEPLVMTFGTPTEGGVTAETVVNDWEEENIQAIIEGYGEDRHARRIARKIVEARKQGRITTSGQLSDIIVGAVGRGGKSHPATKTFQAIRIAVNDELGALRQVLADGFEMLAPGGRMAVISFHSLEDRIVKRYFKELHDTDVARLVTKHPTTPTDEEIETNKRARSAKLRIVEKI